MVGLALLPLLALLGYASRSSDLVSGAAAGPGPRELCAYADDAAALRAATAAMDVERVEQAEEALACASPSLIHGEQGIALRSQIALLKAKRCLAELDWRCARREEGALTSLGRLDDASQLFALTEGALRGAIIEKQATAKRTRDPRVRMAAQRDALEYWGALAQPLKGASIQIEALQAALEKSEAIVAKLDAQDARKRAAEAKRQAAAEERARRAEARRVLAAERAEQRREAGRDSSMLLCNDGTLSPTCTCGRASNRGCCSWHGGVAGCSAD
jgi:hypothetical protein